MKWVTMWGNAQSKVVPMPQRYAKDLTLRYPVLVPFKGNKIRITLDNYCVDEKSKINLVAISKGNSLSDIQLTDVKYLTFNGKREVTLEPNSYATSDECEIDLDSDEFLIVSIYIKDFVNLTGGVDIIGPLSKGYFAYGNQIENNKLDINTSKSTSWVYFLSNIDIYTDDSNKAIICYGDSITSQNWPDELLLSLRENNIKNISVVRKAVSGTRILRQYECITYQSYGLKGSNRFSHEVGSVSGAYAIIIQHGINDIIHPVGEDVNIFRPMSDLPTSSELIEGINYYINLANEFNLKVYVGTLLPIFNWRTYAPFREKLKNDFNFIIRNNYNCIDFEEEIGQNIEGVWKFKDGCDSGDHLHPSKYAYKLMGSLACKKILEEV
jgi:lysophospholipase L1-like esterase